MDIHLTDWLGQHLWLLWLTLAALLVSLELLRSDRVFLGMAGAAGITAVIAVFTPHSWSMHLTVFVVLGIAAALLLRRRVTR